MRTPAKWFRHLWQRQTRRPQAPRARARLHLESLEDRSLLSTAFDAVGLTALRQNATFSAIDGRLPDGGRVSVAVVDTGVFAAHQDLRGNFVAYYDAVTRQEGNLTAARDPNGHGTHVAGTAASTNPEYGVATGAGLIGIRALFDPQEEQPRHDTVSEALSWVLRNRERFNIRVVNMSLGVGVNNRFVNVNSPTPGDERNSVLARQITQLEQLGVTVVTASGNNYASFAAPGASAPAIYSSLSVANTWPDNGINSRFPSVMGQQGADFYAVENDAARDRLAATSQRSTLSNQVAAPGSTILSTSNTGGVVRLSGTSMASPMVAGMVALVQDAAQTFGGRYLPVGDVIRILRDTADSIVDSNVTTNGRIPSSARPSTIEELRQLTQPLAETGLTFLRVNILRAIERVRQEVTSGGGGGGGGGTTPADTNATRETAVQLPSLNGTRDFILDSQIGRDGTVQLGVNDVDVYRIVLDSPGLVTFRVDPVPEGTSFDAYLRLFNSAGQQIAFADDTSGLYPTLTSQQLAAGTYYFGISSYNNSAYNITDGSNRTGGTSQGDYRLTVFLTNPDPNGIITGAVPFEGLPNAYPGTIGSDPPPLNSSRRVEVGPGDVDMFEVIAPDDGTLTIDLDSYAASGNPAPFDTYVRVFSATGVQLAANDDNTTEPFPNNRDSFLQVNLLRSQRVFVAVSTFGNQTYSATNPFNRTAPTGGGGQYNIFLTFDNGDRNGSVFTAVNFAIGDTVNGTIGADFGGPTIGRDGSLDVDFLHYRPTADGLLDVSVTSPDGTLTPLLALWAFDDQRQDIIRVADTAGQSPRLIARVTGLTDYYVSVTGQGNSGFQWFAPATGTGGDTGNYRLTTALRPNTDLVGLADDTIQFNNGWTTVTVGSRISGLLGTDGNLASGTDDIDLYRFVAPATQVVRVQTFADQEEMADTFLRVFDAAGAEIGFNDNANPQTRSSALEFQAVQGQTYYIGINGAGPQARAYNPLNGAAVFPGSQGPYLLTINSGDWLVTAPDEGGPPLVRVFSPEGTLVNQFFAYGEAFSGGVRVAVGDVNADAVPEIFTAPGPGGLPFVNIFNGLTSQLLRQVQVYGETFLGGVNLTVADVLDRGLPQIITAPDVGGQPFVNIFDPASGGFLQQLQVYGETFLGGVRLAAADVNGDNLADILTAPQAGGLPFVNMFDARSRSLLRQTLVYGPSFTGGIFLATGDLDADGRRDLFVGPGSGGQPFVNVFDIASGSLLRQFLAYGITFTAGVRVGALDVNRDGRADVLTAPGPTGQPYLRVLDGLTASQLGLLLAYQETQTNGLFLASIRR